MTEPILLHAARSIIGLKQKGNMQTNTWDLKSSETKVSCNITWDEYSYIRLRHYWLKKQTNKQTNKSHRKESSSWNERECIGLGLGLHAKVDIDLCRYEMIKILKNGILLLYDRCYMKVFKIQCSNNSSTFNIPPYDTARHIGIS